MMYSNLELTIMTPLNAAGVSAQSMLRSLPYLPITLKADLMAEWTSNPVAHTTISASNSCPSMVRIPVENRRSILLVIKRTFGLPKDYKTK